ncbi:hypothetical protein [Microlunatus flavus]|uniref:Uncharacterized protein n=1 Tax=Microlunatus flavus TaxID=1036181 RepID=A0A1H9HLB2_9ACTN|nr:hypothetical protein [Microlunatus flavus]SEQ63113.1 hypothetical protein SAMN05421756_104304 [Microlunatus flavus]
MAPTERPPAPDHAPQQADVVAPGQEPLTADLDTRTPRVSTRALVYAVGVLALLVVVAGVVAFVMLHQPRLTPLPLPSVSSIA